MFRKFVGWDAEQRLCGAGTQLSPDGVKRSCRLADIVRRPRAADERVADDPARRVLGIPEQPQGIVAETEHHVHQARGQDMLAGRDAASLQMRLVGCPDRFDERTENWARRSPQDHG